MTDSLEQIVQQADYWRGSSPEAQLTATQVPFKEWQHFVIFGPGWVLVFNLNLDGGIHGCSEKPKARVITIFSDERWLGQVDKCAQPELKRGSIAANFSDAGMQWRAGGYDIWQRKPGIKIEAHLKPVAIPSLTHNIPLGAGSSLSWCLVPRLSASGWVEIEGKKTFFENLGAYHDHNWGRFHWGGDFSWEWGCALPEDPENPWTFVYARMNSKDRNAITATSAFVLYKGRHVRYFRNAEVAFSTSGEADPHIAGRIPAAAALLLADEDYDIAETTAIRARRGADWVDAEVKADIRGQVLVPSELAYCKVVRLNEATARVNVKGHCAGRDISFEGPGLLEVVRV